MFADNADMDNTAECGERQLAPGEQLIRTDLVNVSLGGAIGDPRLATMSITSMRLLFDVPHTPSGYRWKAWTIGLLRSPAGSFMARERTRPPLSRPQEVALTEIRKIWKWHPPLSDALLIELDTRPTFWRGNGINLALLTGEIPDQRFADAQSRIEHAETIEHAWHAARANAPVGTTAP
jgi:hypothetical protein